MPTDDRLRLASILTGRPLSGGPAAPVAPEVEDMVGRLLRAGVTLPEPQCRFRVQSSGMAWDWGVYDADAGRVVAEAESLDLAEHIAGLLALDAAWPGGVAGELESRQDAHDEALDRLREEVAELRGVVHGGDGEDPGERDRPEDVPMEFGGTAPATENPHPVDAEPPVTPTGGRDEGSSLAQLIDAHIAEGDEPVPPDRDEDIAREDYTLAAVALLREASRALRSQPPLEDWVRVVRLLLDRDRDAPVTAADRAVLDYVEAHRA